MNLRNLKKIRIPKLSPTITALSILFALVLNVVAIYKWVDDPVVTGYAIAWHLAYYVILIGAVRTLQTGDGMIGIGHMIGVVVVAYFSKMLSETMTGPAWQPLLYNTNLVVCLLLSASFLSTLTGKNSSKVHDGAFDEDYTEKKARRNFFKKKSDPKEPEDIPFQEKFQGFDGGYTPGGR